MGAAPVYDPVSEFSPSSNGQIWNFETNDGLFQLSGGTTAVTAFGDRIGYAFDWSLKGNHAIQATAATRPYKSGVPRTFGSELVPDGHDMQDENYTKGTGYTIVAGRAVAVAGTASLLDRAIELTAGRTYSVVFNIIRTAGTVTAQFTGGTTFAGSARNVTGSYVEQFVANTNTTLTFSKDATFAGTIFNITVREVLTFTNPGAYFYANDMTNSATINLSGGGLMTLMMAFKQDAIQSGSQNVAVFGVHGSLSGSVLFYLATQPFMQLWGTAGAIVNVPTAERGSGIAGRQYVNTYKVNMSGATIADQVKIRCRNTIPTQTTSGSLNGAVALANSRFRLGTANLRGLHQRGVMINETLSDAAVQRLDDWLMQGKVYAAVLGDSTVGITSSPTPNAQKVSDFCGGLVCGAADVSEAGSRIADQLAYWTAIADKTKLQVVIVQIGLNDVKGRVGANTATSAQVIAEYQSLIDTINADKPAGCKVVVSQMTPCKVWLDAAAFAAAAYAAWQNLNEAIAGLGATPITGVDGRVTAHVALMKDGSDNLLAILDHNLDGVHDSNEGRFINALDGWRATLESMGVLAAAA